MSRQSYVSNELTHFVGASLKEDPPLAGYREKQFELFIDILNSGELKGKEEFPGHDTLPLPDFLDQAESLKGEFTRGLGVCFCDIPIGDMGIHIEKYSEFGLAFSKNKLIKQGANPVWYIPENSIITEEYFQRMEKFEGLLKSKVKGDADKKILQSSPFPENNRKKFIKFLLNRIV
ncbi:unnamed protein product, partial [marine sediment metagenome]